LYPIFGNVNFEEYVDAIGAPCTAESILRQSTMDHCSGVLLLCRAVLLGERMIDRAALLDLLALFCKDKDLVPTLMMLPRSLGIPNPLFPLGIMSALALRALGNVAYVVRYANCHAVNNQRPYPHGRINQLDVCIKVLIDQSATIQSQIDLDADFKFIRMIVQMFTDMVEACIPPKPYRNPVTLCQREIQQDSLTNPMLQAIDGILKLLLSFQVLCASSNVVDIVGSKLFFHFLGSLVAVQEGCRLMGTSVSAFQTIQNTFSRPYHCQIKAKKLLLKLGYKFIDDTLVSS
jgi:hypothetical protein